MSGIWYFSCDFCGTFGIAPEGRAKERVAQPCVTCGDRIQAWPTSGAKAPHQPRKGTWESQYKRAHFAKRIALSKKEKRAIQEEQRKYGDLA